MPLYEVYLQIETCLTCLHEKIEQGCRLNYRVQACSLPCRSVIYQNARTQSPLFVANLCSRRKI
nr:MAG TPA: hypothetical protein [Caudoviricetes sp.]